MTLFVYEKVRIRRILDNDIGRDTIIIAYIYTLNFITLIYRSHAPILEQRTLYLIAITSLVPISL